MSEQTEQTSKTKKILLIGNGFDLRTGVKTTFRDFFRFVIYGVIWHNYSKSEVIKTMITKSEFTNFKPDSEISPEELFEKFFEEKIKNKVKTIADVQRETESKNWDKEHPGKKLFPSKHPLEILLEIEKEEKKNSKTETVFDYCRKFIDSELGQIFFKHLFKSPYLEEALRIDLSDPGLSLWYSHFVDHDNSYEKKVLRWSVIYGIKDDWAEMEAHNCIPNDTRLEEGLETIAHIVEANFEKNRSNITLWSDVETVIQLLITRDKELQTKYSVSDANLPTWNYETLKSFSEGLDIFELLLTKYFKAITEKLDIVKRFGSESRFLESIYNAHIHSLFKRTEYRSAQKEHDHVMLPHEFMDILYSPDIVINYNYTNIAEKIYKNKENIKHVHINGELYHNPGFDPSIEGFETNIVIGYRNYKKYDVPKDLRNFEKFYRRKTKGTKPFNLDTLIKNNTNFDLLIIGHSCCEADSDIIGDLLKHEKLRKALILCHTKNDLDSINNNIIDFLGTEPTKYSELMTYSEGKESHNLFYAVEQPKEQEEMKNKDKTEGIREFIKQWNHMLT